MNNLDKDYQALLQDILVNGHFKGDRTGTGTKSVFPRMITHNMAEGFPLLTTKKMYHKGIFTELLWLLRGETNIQWLCQNGCNIWVGDAYKKYCKEWGGENKYSVTDTMTLEDGSIGGTSRKFNKGEFIEKIKTDDAFAEKWGDLGPIYGKQWRNWQDYYWEYGGSEKDGGKGGNHLMGSGIDQIANALDELTNNPDNRRILVNAWNVAEIKDMTLPPCHFGFQLWTRELTWQERRKIAKKTMSKEEFNHTDDKGTSRGFGYISPFSSPFIHHWLDKHNIPKRAISLTWQQRSVDTFLGLPFNIASYGALLMIFGELVNMVPETLTGMLGDTHLYSNHFEQAEEQIGRELTRLERVQQYGYEYVDGIENEDDHWMDAKLKVRNIPTHTRVPYPLPNLRISTEFWNPENVLGTNWDEIIKGIELDDFRLENYKSHMAIRAPLSN